MMPEEYRKLFRNELFREIMDDIADVVMVIDKETYIVYVNHAYEKTLNP